MKSEELGLPIFYQEYPEYFDGPDDVYSLNEKNEVVEKLLSFYGVKNVLDMACGTGAQVLYLAKLGYEVVGADFSPGLLELAREKAMAENVKVEFVDGDMRSLRLGECDGVITIDNAIGHLVRYDFEVALRNIYNNLKDGGIYVFDILNLEAMTDEVVESDSERMTDKRVMSDGVVISNKRVSWVDRDKGLITSENNFVIEKNGEKKEIKNKCSLQIYTMEELRDILARNGFELVEQYKIDAYSFKKDDLGYSIMNVARKK